MNSNWLKPRSNNLVLLAFLKFKESREVDKSNISLTIMLLVNYDLRNQLQYRLTYVVNDSNL